MGRYAKVRQTYRRRAGGGPREASYWFHVPWTTWVRRWGPRRTSTTREFHREPEDLTLSAHIGQRKLALSDRGS
jgi:hypothetical protein